MSSDLPSRLPLGLVLQKLTVVDRLRCERVSPGWQRAVWDWGWTEQRTLDHNTLFEGVPEGEVADRRLRFWANGYKNLLLLLKLTKKNLLELDLSSFYPEHLLPFLQQICESLSQLQALQTLNIREFELSDFVDFLPPTLRRLKTDWFSVQTLEALAEKCPRLEKVPFHRVRGINLEVLNEFIGKFPSQKSLSVPYIYNGASREIESYAATIAAFVRLEKLEALNCCPWDALDDRSFRAIVSGCPRLRRFSYKSGRLTEGALLRLAQLPLLVDLEIDATAVVGAFTTDVLRAIAKRGLLKSLIIQRSKLTDDDVEHLLQACKQLVTLNLFRTPKITDRSLRAVVDEVHRRYGDPPRVLPSGPRDNGIFFFPCVGDDSFSFVTEMTYREMQGDEINSIDWGWARWEAQKNPWLYCEEHFGRKRRKLY